jgi:hypothetical protein
MSYGGRGYIGARSTNTHPDLDTTYLGSFSDKKFKPSEKIIIQTFSSREEAIDAEINLHNFYQVDINPHFANKRKQTSKKFDYGEKRNPMEGKSHSLETKILISKKMKQKMKEKEHKEKLSKIQQKLVWWNNGLIQTRSQFSPGPEFVRGQLPSSSENKKGEKNNMWGKRGKLAPCFGRTGSKHPLFGKKHSIETRQKMSLSHGKGENSLAFGKKWWNNGEIRKFSKECPGEGFVLGYKLI